MFLVICGHLACSLPNLEKPECIEARDAVKQFYSFHFANDMTRSPENLKLRERFLTQEYYRTLGSDTKTKGDVFTASEDPPKTFKIGKCEVPQPDKVELQVQVYWRDDQATVQKDVHVETIRTGGGWRINKVSN